MLQLLIKERNCDFRETETEDCGDLRLSLSSAKVALL